MPENFHRSSGAPVSFMLNDSSVAALTADREGSSLSLSLSFSRCYKDHKSSIVTLLYVSI